MIFYFSGLLKLLKTGPGDLGIPLTIGERLRSNHKSKFNFDK